MKALASIWGFILSAFKSLNWISTLVNLGMILFVLVFHFKIWWAVIFSVLICFAIVLADYGIPLIFKNKTT